MKFIQFHSTVSKGKLRCEKIINHKSSHELLAQKRKKNRKIIRIRREVLVCLLLSMTFFPEAEQEMGVSGLKVANCFSVVGG